MKALYFFKEFLEQIILYAKRITLPGFDKIPLYDVAVFFWKGITRGSVSSRASSVAYSFFLAIFPAIIFFFTLIPYIPIEDFQLRLLLIIEDIVPANAFLLIQGTVEDIVTKQRSGLLSFGFFAAMIFSTNGISSMIDAFNASYYTTETRGWIAQRLISAVLVLILATLITTAISIIVISETAMNYLVEAEFLRKDITFYLLILAKWIIVVAMFFTAISFLYYLAPSKRKKFRFISAGSSLATVLTIIFSLAFSYYINHFGRYNTLYGSIGTVMVILVWLYFNALSILIGFELNSSIKNAKIDYDRG